MMEASAYRRFPWFLIVLMFLLLAEGFLFVTSAAYNVSVGGYGSDPYKQGVWIAIGLGVFAVCLLVRYGLFGRWAYGLYAAGLAATTACYVFPAVNGAHRWIFFNGAIKVQPTEFMKLILPLTLARYLAYRKNVGGPGGLIGPLLVAGIPILVILMQPDLGSALVFVPMVLAVLFVAGARKRDLSILVTMGLALGVGFYFSPWIKPHQKARVQTLLNPSAAPLREGYQLAQSKIAIGSGGLTGKGLYNGTQNYLGHLPFNSTDFIFAVIGEEWGFSGTAGTLLAYSLLLWCGLAVAARTRDPFGRLTVVGLLCPMAVQVVVNTGMTVGLVPITGLTLPLISYGGSSMIATLAALGLVCNVSVRRPIVLAPETFRISPPQSPRTPRVS